ncbi:hypothetical protein Pla123a_42820 [Posidoniimonas polymericola]|uniref:Uncharacterized protein n=1 Tax=Posidoniimonas polymericola TaxID=2528002 RepID=A0A5C5XWK0_9BACT|nr:hypothetical protein [Posidoniimonas polymericola]TWT67726.1 hypothetical protein Pla123a_42820 [Posidoniimonas polymericola]
MSKLAARLFASLLFACGAAVQVGCSACGSCHDYSSPVANCSCQGCSDCGGGSRAGSRSMGYYAENGAKPDVDSLDQAVEVARLPDPDAPLRR